MSDRNSNNTIIPDNVLSLPSVVFTLSRTLNAEVDEDMEIPRKPRGNGTHTTTSVRTPATTFSIGLMKTKICTTSIEMAQMIFLLISKQFTMTAEVTTEPLVQLSAYFAHTGIHNEEYLSFMMNYVDWLPPQTIATPKQKMNFISIPVTLLLSYTVALQEEKLYLSPGIGYRALTTWFAEYNRTSMENLNKSSQIVILTVKNTETKIPAFKVPICRGDILDGDEYIWMVKSTFRSNTMSQFLEDPNHCENLPYWSGYFSSRLRESIEESNILSFLATELDVENNYARVWTQIEKHLLSTGIKTTWVMTNWSSLLSSKCEDRDSFLSFYSKTKGIIHKLTKGTSIAAKDNVFLEAYLSMEIETTELQTEVKGFLRDTKATYSEILELIHADFRV